MLSGYHYCRLLRSVLAVDAVILLYSATVLCLIIVGERISADDHTFVSISVFILVPARASKLGVKVSMAKSLILQHKP